MRANKLGAVFGAILIADAAHALPQNAVVVGAGAMECRLFLADDAQQNRNVKMLVISWAQGYLTRQNLQFVMMEKPLLKALEPDAIYDFLVKFCREHPQGDINTGVLVLIDQLHSVGKVEAKP